MFATPEVAQVGAYFYFVSVLVENGKMNLQALQDQAAQ
jgi:hypothetical protein